MRIHKTDLSAVLLAALTLLMSAACTTSSIIPEGDKRYTGIKDITYTKHEKNSHSIMTQQEVEAALSCPPNGSLFGSSRYRSPIQIRLWIWNAFSNKESKFSKWLTKSFGKAPVLMSTVNPELRASVAQSVLVSHGYFNGTVTSEEIESKNPVKAKVSYHVDMGHLHTIDSLHYGKFPPDAQALIDSTLEESLVKAGDPFDVTTLDGERNRISSLLRDNGYYYFQPGYASYLADTVNHPGMVNLRLQMADSLPDRALRKWIIGKMNISLRKTFSEQLTQSISRRRFAVNFSGKKSPIRMRVLMRNIKLRPGRPFCYSDYIESANKLASNGIFSRVDFNFTPRETPPDCDTLDLNLNCVFDKPYDFYVESNLKGKTTGFLGPQLIVGLSKRNAFRGAEILDINMHGSYEWQTGHMFDDTESRINSYEYGGDISLDFPRFLKPWDFNEKRRRRRPLVHAVTPERTIIKASTNMVNRSGFFRRHIVSGELTYKYQYSPFWTNQFTPLSVEYNYMNSMTEKFYELLHEHPYLMATMLDLFIPKAKYILTYTNASKSHNPVWWQTTFSEAGNVMSLGYMAFGKKWDTENKKFIHNPYAQFLKVETEFTKTWLTGDHSTLVGHVGAGVAWAYGNSSYIPYTEQFWVGGANSIRAFNVRSIGPGKYHSMDKRWRFVEEVGDLKLQANIEYRPRLFGNLYGALFVDAGNVWNMRDNPDLPDDQFKIGNVLDEMAVGTGIGFRYDLDYFVIRIDWGIGIHAPYDTGKRGYFNMPSFGDAQSIHLAIGYPF